MSFIPRSYPAKPLNHHNLNGNIDSYGLVHWFVCVPVGTWQGVCILRPEVDIGWIPFVGYSPFCFVFM